MKGYMYILECADGSFYTGSTKNLEKRLLEHQGLAEDHEDSRGSYYTRVRRPVKLVYYEEHARIDEAFLSGKTGSEVEPPEEEGTY